MKTVGQGSSLLSEYSLLQRIQIMQEGPTEMKKQQR